MLIPLQSIFKIFAKVSSEMVDIKTETTIYTGHYHG